MRLLAFIGALGLVAAIGAVVFFFGGYYSVGGTAPEPDIVKWALVQVRQASIARHATDNPPGAFDDKAVAAGARAYAARGCANCHGAPGVDWQKFSEGLRPDPPDLKDIVKERPASQLFWVIKNGINMTGMPSFALADVKDPEIWTIVAFLKKLPDVSDADYRSWISMPTPAPDAAAPTSAAPTVVPTMPAAPDAPVASPPPPAPPPDTSAPVAPAPPSPAAPDATPPRPN